MRARRRYRRMGLVGCAVLALLAVAAPGARAQGPDGRSSDRFVTFVARECAEYTDIMANRARNDIQESLRDLGHDSTYEAGYPIDPITEAEQNPSCIPITGWRFTLGTGILTRAVSGPWGSLSIVTGPFDTEIVTQAQGPLRDAAGRPTGQSLAGAVTIELTQAQAQRAAKSSSLWVQGGTPTDPILDEIFPGVYGFGALRCAIDNLNGDNVEWIAYPSGTEHVFCFAYYVKPPPTSGTIVIRKEIAGVDGASEVFAFDGNLSFNPGGQFTLAPRSGQPASATFYRAAGPEPWRVRELVPAGWRLTGLDCTHQGASVVTTDLATAEARIVLAAGDTVTCTFTDEPRPAGGRLFIRKISEGGTGLFDFRILPLVEGGQTARARARTQEEGVPVDAVPSPIELAPGSYRVRERLPRARGGRWRLVGATCDGRRVRRPDPHVDVRITADDGTTCTFLNRFIPRGALTILKQTLGGTGTAGFAISRVDGPHHVFEQTATTTAEGVPVPARGDSTSRLPLGTYVIQEVEPHGAWTLRHVTCNGRLVPATEGRVTVRLTRAQPRLRCEFTNVLASPPPPPFDPPGPNVVPGGPQPDLAIAKHADRSTAGLGELVTFTVVVRNHGNATAENVIVLEDPGGGLTLVRDDPRCAERAGLVGCRIPFIAPGDSARLSFVMRVDAAAPGAVRNLAVVGSESAEPRVRDNIAVAGVSARRLVCIPGIGYVPVDRARAAC